MYLVSLAGWLLLAVHPGNTGESPSPWTLTAVSVGADEPDESAASPQDREQQGEDAAAVGAAAKWFETLEVQIHGNFFGSRDDRRINDTDGNQIDDRMFIREVDVDFGADVGDAGTAFVSLSYRADPVASHEADLAQAYVLLDKLPLVGELPWDLNVQVGKFRSAFGHGNLRIFELPQPTRPLPVRYYLGEDGFTSTGIAGRLRVPLAEEHVLGVDIEGTNSGDLPLTDAVGEQPFATVLKGSWAWTPGRRTEVNAAISHYEGRKQPARLNAVSLAFTRRSADPESAGALLLGAEMFEGQTLSTVGAARETPVGYYAFGMIEVLPDLYAGLRFDTAEEVADASQETRSVGVYLTYAGSKYVRYSIGWETFESDVVMIDGRNSVIFELNFALGPRPIEPAWAR